MAGVTRSSATASASERAPSLSPHHRSEFPEASQVHSLPSKVSNRAMGVGPERLPGPRCAPDSLVKGEAMNSRLRSIVAGAVVSGLGVTEAAAQTSDLVSAGNGGVATSAANGGAVGLGNVNSGGNAGNAIGADDTWGDPVGVDAGTVGNATTLGVSANGGSA